MNMEDEVMALKTTVAGCEKEHQDFKRRLDNHAEALKELRDIFIVLEKQSNAIERMGNALDRVEKTVDSVDSRVTRLESEPGEKWKKVTWEIVKYVVLALVGLAVGWILKTPGA